MLLKKNAYSWISHLSLEIATGFALAMTTIKIYSVIRERQSSRNMDANNLAAIEFQTIRLVYLYGYNIKSFWGGGRGNAVELRKGFLIFHV
ncbi:hypothetical protein Desti_4670 [Desulfomonile tiedjei DSM 6799]|uniref:Uncharacterized protein n=1 Tax=Desulfomonile tiedjei (strain ATCC 49306 / DSM 6799 / DCB-1) TaxID=706587 RepID=I4CCK1_DESTA|nr:hypothetical protein Desti_4670 [Desulfomonile tiedjei DSM 6799]